MTWSLFPKLLKGMAPNELAAVVKKCGLDTVNAVVREGFWVDPANLGPTLRAFVDAMAGEGVVVSRASTGFMAHELAMDGGPLPTLAEAGITEARLGWHIRRAGSMREDRDRAKRDMERAAQACARHGVRAIVQLHMGTLFSSPSAVHWLLEGVDPRFSAVEIDPGNQAFEGHEGWDYTCELLGGQIAWVGAKDSIPVESGGAWRRAWTPSGTGSGDWPGLFGQLKAIGFDGTIVLMPFYSEGDAGRLVQELKGETAWLKRQWEAA